MAQHYQTIGSFPTVQVISPTQVLDVIRIGFSTIPSGVVAYANAPGKAYTAALADKYIEPLAAAIEGIMGLGYVASIVHEEDVDAGGLLHDLLAVTVEYDPGPPNSIGPFQGTVRVPVHVGPGLGIVIAKMVLPIKDLYAQLQATAGL